MGEAFFDSVEKWELDRAQIRAELLAEKRRRRKAIYTFGPILIMAAVAVIWTIALIW